MSSVWVPELLHNNLTHFPSWWIVSQIWAPSWAVFISSAEVYPWLQRARKCNSNIMHINSSRQPKVCVTILKSTIWSTTTVQYEPRRTCRLVDLWVSTAGAKGNKIPGYKTERNVIPTPEVSDKWLKDKEQGSKRELFLRKKGHCYLCQQSLRKIRLWWKPDSCEWSWVVGRRWS